MRKAVFLDRDGVINEKPPEDMYVRNWSEFRFRNGSIEGMRRLRELGYLIVVVTNQRGIARGLMSETDLLRIHAKMQARLAVDNACADAIYYCPHERGECDCRKPGIGMLLEAEKAHSIHKDASFLIGDSITDLQAGEWFGIRSYLLDEKTRLDQLVDAIVSGEMRELV